MSTNNEQKSCLLKNHANISKNFAIKIAPLFLFLIKSNYLCSIIALLCNGSTADSGSVCSGSSPDGATKETTKRLIFKYDFQAFFFWGKNRGKNEIVLYDKSIGKGKFIPEFTEQVEFKPDIVSDEYVLSWCSWEDLQKRITKEMLDDRQQDIFESLIQSEMETNPILIKYYFK